MSLALIQETAKEVRRLAIAGSPLAVGDFRLKKLTAPLEQAGAKVPVFGQVAKAINDVVNGTEADAAANLLHLSTLLNAILYTQGQSSVEGEWRELETFATTTVSTRTPARLLKPLVQALSSTGSGRFETVQSAFERGAFNDLRLIAPAIQALDDAYPDLADLVTEKILPGYGPGIVPLLQTNLDLKGKKSDARRLHIIHALNPAGTLPLCKTALEDGSPEVKIAAIACLGKHEDCLPLVLEQAKAKNKQVRAAALEALAEHDRAEVTNLFTELIGGKMLDILAGPFRALKNRQVLHSLLNEGNRVFSQVLQGDAEQLPRYCEILNCLNERRDAVVEEFLLACFQQGDKLGKVKAPPTTHVSGADIVSRLAGLLYNLGTPKALEAILARQETLPPSAYSVFLRSALRSWSAALVFKEFSPLLEQTKGAGKDKSDELERAFLASRRIDLAVRGEVDLGETESAAMPPDPAWDPRWLDAAIKANRPLIVWCLARPQHPATITYLLGLPKTKTQFNPGMIIHALARCQYPQTVDVLLAQISQRTGGAKHFDYELQSLFESVRHLPATDLPKLDAFAATLDEKFVDRFLEAIAPLRSSSQQSQTNQIP